MWQGDPAGLAQIDPEMDLLALPFVINSPSDVSRVFGPGGVGTEITNSLDKHGLKLLAFQELGWINLDTTTPVKTLANLKGLKLRAQPDEIQPVLFSTVGAQPASLDITEVFTALQTKTISGFGDPLTVIEGGKYNTVAPNITMANVIYNPCVVVVNKAFFESLSPSQQQILQSSATEVAAQEVKKDRAAQNAALATMKQQGSHVYTMSPSDLAKWKSDLAPLYKTWEAKYGSLATRLINGS